MIPSVPQELNSSSTPSVRLPNADAMPNQMFVCLVTMCKVEGCLVCVYGSVMSLTLDAVPPTAMRVCR